jgi:hypothetical protein
MDFLLVRVELAQQKCVVEQDRTKDLSSGIKLDAPHPLSVRLQKAGEIEGVRRHFILRQIFR